MPIDKVQSKWDLDHARQQRDLGEAAIKSNEPEPTSKAVVWPKVKHIDGYSFSNIVPPLRSFTETIFYVSSVSFKSVKDNQISAYHYVFYSIRYVYWIVNRNNFS